MHAERPATICLPAGTRATITFKKLPRASPGAATITASAAVTTRDPGQTPNAPSRASNRVAKRNRVLDLVVLVRVILGIDVDVEVDCERWKITALASHGRWPQVPCSACRRSAPGAPD